MSAEPRRGKEAGTAFRTGTLLPVRTLVGLLLAGFSAVLIAIVSVQSAQSRADSARALTATLEVVARVQAVLATMKDAETGQRGYIVTGEESYLDPYSAARARYESEFQHLRDAIATDATQKARTEEMASIATQKFAELEQTIVLRHANRNDEALAIVRSNRGKELMERFRRIATEMEGEERNRFEARRRDWERESRLSLWITWGGMGLLLFLIVAAGWIASRDYRERERNAWIRAGENLLGNRMRDEQRLDRLGEEMLSFLASYVGALVGAVYTANADGTYERIAGYALDPAAASKGLRPGESLVGQAGKEGRALHIADVPEEYLPISTGIVHGTPRHLLVAPAIADGEVHGVVEIGLLRPIDDADLELMDRIGEDLAVAIRSAKERERREQLLEETQQQSEELQSQQEELRVSNEELEEQGRALRESQSQLGQINVQLEENAERLHAQNDALARAQESLADRAAELERAGRYKSEFLANMSHELRTPLNSTLILAKLLADNAKGNLDEEQRNYARTIHSAGNDLLALINDILDLSKIEAGHLDVCAEPVDIAQAIAEVVKSLAPMAGQKGLALRPEIDPGAPASITTDGMRLGQILRNLLSNAVKFTEQGEVVVRTFAPRAGRIAFEVRDTGIGIPEEQREFIFDAFRQADGSTHRKYGGTGLGLTISRDLARLLGGELSLASTVGKGSAFTLELPEKLEPSAGQRPERPPSRPALPPLPPLPPASQQFPALRSREANPAMPAGARVILIVEDDTRFAAIMGDITREMGFTPVYATTGIDALAAAERHEPMAILLDINLPDYSGLGVLDQLKRTPRTRHIPVHVVSAADHAREALERGAVGYTVKPVQREQVVAAVEGLQARIAQQVRRVLVVEDDAVQRESVIRLLSTNGVEVIGVKTAQEALRQLAERTFDCMVMDLDLPDLSGHELLERMAGDDVAHPPVIIYTAASLPPEAELGLRRLSQSIILKEARSPERLLDEVTLFLHKVEADLPPESQRALQVSRDRDSALEGRRVLVVEDDVRNIFALSAVLEPRGAKVSIARNGREALTALEKATNGNGVGVDLVLMDIMMPEMDGLTAMREIRARPEWQRLPIIALTAKAMKDDRDKCLAAGANDYIAKPLDVEKLLSLVRVWMPR